MREVERRAVKAGIDGMVLMENAGANAARLLDEKTPIAGKSLLIFCGSGNNAGDGLVFARHALIHGATVRVYFVKGDRQLKPLALRNYKILKNLRREGREGSIGFPAKLEGEIKADMIIDAILGIGVRGDVDETCRKAIERINSTDCYKVSLDCPSGIDGDTGSVLGAAVMPDVTITFHEVKMGMDRSNSGEIIVADIGIPAA